MIIYPAQPESSATRQKTLTHSLPIPMAIV